MTQKEKDIIEGLTKQIAALETQVRELATRQPIHICSHPSPCFLPHYPQPVVQPWTYRYNNVAGAATQPSFTLTTNGLNNGGN